MQVTFVAKNKPNLLKNVLSCKAKLIDPARSVREAVGYLQPKREAFDAARRVLRNFRWRPPGSGPPHPVPKERKHAGETSHASTRGGRV